MHRPDARQLFARMATYACTVLAFLALAIAGLSGAAIVLFLPVAYREAGGVVPLLVLGMSVQSLAWFLATSLNIAKQTRVYPMVTAIGAVSSIAANLLLIPPFGMFGAALALVVSQTSATVAIAYFAQRAYHIPYETGRLTQVVTVTVLVYAAMLLIPAVAPWQTFVLRILVLALFPLGLYVFQFFRPSELRQIRDLVFSLGLKARAG